MSTFVLYLHDDEYISNHIRKYGCWEPITSEILLELWSTERTSSFRRPLSVHSQTTFVDVGANIGYFTLGALQQGIQTVAFEPIASNYNLLRSSIIKNGYENSVKTYMVALSDIEERVNINVSKKNMGLCSTRKLLDSDYSYTQSCITKRFDDYFGIDTKNPLIVKIDVEEQETKVLKGMTETLRSGKVTHIIIEISKYDKELFNILREFGYDYVVNIGYTNETSVSQTINIHSNHLNNPIYHTTIDVLENEMIKDLNTDNTQRMILFYKTPTHL